MEKQQFTFKGRLSEIKPVKSGQGAKGEWAAIDFEVTEDSAEYPQVGMFSMFKNGEYLGIAKDFANTNKVGDIILVSFNLAKNTYTKKDGSRQGVFYKNNAWKIEKVGGTAKQGFEDTSSGGLTLEDERQDLPY